MPFPKVKRHDFPEGRGILVETGRIVTVQLPLARGSAWGFLPIEPLIRALA